MPGRSRFEWLYLGNSLIVMGISLIFASFFASFALAVVSREGLFGAPEILILLALLLVTLVLMVLQYGAAFRRSDIAAAVLGALLIVGGALLAIFVGGREGGFSGATVLALAAVALAMYGLFSGWLNLRWSRRLRHAVMEAGDQSQQGAARLPPFQFTLRELLVWTAILSVFLGLTTWQRRALWDQPYIDKCREKLEMIGIALQNHSVESREGRFPAYRSENGGNRYSWRLYVLPYCYASTQRLERMYKRNEPWDGPNNRKLSQQIVPYYACPVDRRRRPPDYTTYVAVTEPGADGIPEITCIVEVANSGIICTEPRDFTKSEWEEILKKKKNPSEHPGGYHVLHVKGPQAWQVEFVPVR